MPFFLFVCFQRKNDVIIPVYFEYSAPQSRMLGIHFVYSRIGIATQSNGCSGLFHLFLFRNKVNRKNPKFTLNEGHRPSDQVRIKLFFFLHVLETSSYNTILKEQFTSHLKSLETIKET